MEAGTSSTFLTGKNWPFQRSQEELGNYRSVASPEELAITGKVGSSADTASSFGPPSSVLQPAAFDIAVNSLKDPKTFADITAKHAEWEKQLESADEKQHELFHFQWNLIREQLSSVTREIAQLRQDNDILRATEQRREVRDADFARVVRETQSELEKEDHSRRKDGEEYFSAVVQLKQAIENERSDRSQALQAIERDVAEQMQSVKLQQRQQLEADKDLSSRFEHWCMELRATLDKESSVRGLKLDELQQEGGAVALKLEKETQERTASIDELKLRRFEDEELRLVDLSAKEAIFQERIDELSGKHGDILLHHKNLAERVADLTDALNRTTSASESFCSELKKDIVILSEELRASDAALLSSLELVKQTTTDEIVQERKRNVEQHQSHVDRHTVVEQKLKLAHSKIYEDHDTRHSTAEDLLLQSQKTHAAHAVRIEEAHRFINESVARVETNAEKRAAQAASQLLEELGLVSSEDFNKAMTRIWEAIDTHTHDVDVATLAIAQAVPRSPVTPPMAVTPLASPMAVSRVLMPQPAAMRSQGPPSVAIARGSIPQPQPTILLNGANLSMPVPFGSGSLTIPVGTTMTAVPQTTIASPKVTLKRSNSQREMKSSSSDRRTSSLSMSELSPSLSSTVAPLTPLTPNMTQLRLPMRSRSVTPVRR